MVFILWFSTEAGSTQNSVRLLRPVLLWLKPGISEAEIYDTNIFLRKTAHVVQFFVLAFLLWRTREPLLSRRGWRSFRTFLVVTGICFVFAAGSELVQYFMKTRGASVRDVFLDMSGAGAGMAVVFLLRSFLGRNPGERGTTILLTAHTRLDEPGTGALAQLRAAVARTRPDLLVVAGNVGDPRQAESCLRALCEAADGVPVAICLGHLDHQLPREYWPKVPSAAAIREKMWRPASEAAGVCCLDYGNADLDDLVVTGGYGHFDRACEETRDIPHELSTVQEEAARQAANILTRLEQAQKTGKPIVLVTYVPALGESHPGNFLLRAGLATCTDHIALAVHAYGPSPSRTTVSGVPCVGIGSSPGQLAFWVYSRRNGIGTFTAPES